MTPTMVHGLRELFTGRQFKPTVILLSSSVLVCLWRVYGSQAFYTEHLAGRFTLAGDPVATAAWYSIGMCFLLLGLVPLLVIKLVFRERLADYGVQPGNVKVGLLLLLASVPVILIISHWSAPDATLRAEYPLNRHAGQAFAVHAVSLLFFYLGWEFHFRGFLQFGLAGSMGRENSLGVQVLSSCLAHLGKPPAELFASIPAGMYWGLQAYRTQSLWAGLLQHWLLGVSLDYFITFS